jgi:dolichol-phosphate mannosyltransferase
MTWLSIVTPAYNEASNLPLLYERIVQATLRASVDWEWIIVDDHSSDRTFGAVQDLALSDPRVRGIRLSRNSGSHVAITCGLHHATGEAAVTMSADLQDPPEVLGPMLERWRRGAQVVWAVRRGRSGGPVHALFASLYYWMMRHLVGMKDMPSHGADFFLLDRTVIDAFRKFPERNVSVLALITWLGFRQDQFDYDKQPRARGRSGWTFARKRKLVVDSITGFSDFPLRFCSYAGLGLMAIAVIIAIIGLTLLSGLTAAFTLVAALVVAFGGLQLFALGMIGQYVWRGLDESRRRPPYVIESVVGDREAARLGS